MQQMKMWAHNFDTEKPKSINGLTPILILTQSDTLNGVVFYEV